MLTKFFIFAVAILGIATKLSSGIPAHEALAQAYEDTVGGALSLKFTIWRAANCDQESLINRRMTTYEIKRMCKFCVCGVAASDDGTPDVNCDQEPCFHSRKLTDVSVASSWNDSGSLSPWTSIGNATSFQVYAVDDGFCYASHISPQFGRKMKCFTHR